MRQRDLDLKSQEPGKLLIEIRTLIEEARRQTAVAVNIGLTLLYWRIGRRIHREVLDVVATIGGGIRRQLSWSHSAHFCLSVSPSNVNSTRRCAASRAGACAPLRERIDSMLYERTALSKQPDALIRQELAISAAKETRDPRNSQ
jgi:hypothetical protein